jgi:5'-deoxynucleotidase YfbR-like HD superfamily hydrolase
MDNSLHSSDRVAAGLGAFGRIFMDAHQGRIDAAYGDESPLVRANAQVMVWGTGYLSTLHHTARHTDGDGSRSNNHISRATKAMRSGSLDDFITGGFMTLCAHLYTPEQQDFILEQCKKFDRVALGFALFAVTSPKSRFGLSENVLGMQHRVGWPRVGVAVPFAQDVLEHEKSCERLVRALFADDPDIERLASAARYHDQGESIVGDFTPHCDITRADKNTLELLGVRLLTEAKDVQPKAQIVYDACHLYEGDDPKEAHLRQKIRDGDLLDMVIEAAFIRQECPAEEWPKIADKINAFWDYVGERVSTPQGKAFYASFQNAQHGPMARQNLELCLVNAAQAAAHSVKAPAHDSLS